MNKLKEEIAYFMRRLYRQQLTTAGGGNISARFGDCILITPSGLDKARLGADDIGVVNLNGEALGIPFKPSIENRLHLEIYARRPDVKAIVHAHPAAASSYAAANTPMNTRLLAESYVVLGDVAIAGYHCIGSEALARETAAMTANGCNCVLMRNHGALALGGSLLEAFDRLEVMETCARVNLNIMGPPGNPHELRPGDLDELDRLVGRKK